MSQKINLVDVVALSKSACKKPIQGKLAYATVENFVGRIIVGYHPEADDICLLTPKAANALCQVQNYLIEKNSYGLFIFDAYRPKRAVYDFMTWIKLPVANAYETERKIKHYPAIDKSELFIAGYLAEDSGHCYGNTVDLALIDLETGKEIDLGSNFDYMDERSHLNATVQEIGAQAFQNRKILLEAMELFGFHSYEKEIWHYSHGGVQGREVEQPIDVEITPELRGVTA